MENASKALIIAGAILLSIVLITLGVVIIGRGQETVDQANIDDQVVSTWNQKWTRYEGDSVSGTQVNTLINEVISSNKIVSGNGETEKVIGLEITAKASGSNANNKIDVTGSLPLEKDTGSGTGGAEKCTQYAKPNGKYSITTTPNKSGYIYKITIKY
jgi:hypothetical protein